MLENIQLPYWMVVLTIPCTEFWDETSKSYSILNNAGAMVDMFYGYAN